MAWAIAFINEGWTIQWMTWPVFLNNILQGDFNKGILGNNKNVNLVAGGFSLATDYMYFTHTLIFILPLTEVLFSF